MSKFDLETVRHSTAHIMAQAIARVFKDQDIEFGIGPVIDHGFYYDIDMKKSIEDEDLKKIEKEMQNIIDEKLDIEKTILKRDDAIKFFKDKNQNLKVELIEDLAVDEEISLYGQGEFTDLCRGPHVDNTRSIPKFFKLLSIAGAYWRGDSNNKMLQRVYAACFADKKELKKYLNFLEEAKKRDHRKLGKELELFHFEQCAPGSPFFMPKGTIIYNELVSFMRRIYNKFDYDEVITPQILDSDLWQTSGHYEHYKDNMYFSNIDEREYAVKPMNCPCHMLMFKHYKYSFRDLPMRYADFGRLHRYEKAGALAGLTRVRTFCQDDAHIFLQLEQIQDEISKLMEMFFICYKHFDFQDIKVNLSTRPTKKAGLDCMWDEAEDALKNALDKSGHKYVIKEGDGAFYGPKIDIEIADALGRYFQLGTIQLDFLLPEKFDLKYTTTDGDQKRPVVIHRALLGSLERFIGVLIEHVSGAFPFWLAPVQSIIVPVNNENHLEHALKLKEQLKSLGYRVKVDDRNETLGKKTREIQKSKSPFMIVVGDKEIESNSVSLRAYGAKFAKSMPLEEMLEQFHELNLEKMPKELR